MEVRPEEDREAAGVTVKFKGYAFSMPKDARGADATLEGKVNVLDLTPAEVAEFEREGGEIANKNPDGSATTLLVMANGVEPAAAQADTVGPSRRGCRRRRLAFAAAPRAP